MQRSFDELDQSRLSPAAREMLLIIAEVERGESDRAEVLARFGLDDASYEERRIALGVEWTNQSATPVKLPNLSSEEYSALRDSIQANGQRYPILRSFDGTIIDGHHRERACLELGLTPIYETKTGTTDELKSLALVLNLARRQIDSSAKRGIVNAALFRDPTMSDRAIASSVGVGRTLVAAVRKELEAAGEVAAADTRVDIRGVARRGDQPARSAPPEIDDLPEGVLEVKLRIAKEIAGQLDGSWMKCVAVRLVSAGPGIYSLEVQT